MPFVSRRYIEQAELLERRCRALENLIKEKESYAKRGADMVEELLRCEGINDGIKQGLLLLRVYLREAERL